MTEVPGMDLEDGGEIAWLTSPLSGEAEKLKKNVNIIIGRNTGKHPGQVPHNNFYFMALLCFWFNSFQDN